MRNVRSVLLVGVAVVASTLQPGAPAVRAASGPPTAAFTAPSTAACHEQVTLDASASAATGGASIANYAWDFGDGAAGSGLTVGHTFAAMGAYSATLTVTDDQVPPLSASASKVITVRALASPVAVAGGPYLIRDDGTVALDGSRSHDPDASCGDAITQYAWRDGTAIFASGQSPTVSSATVASLFARAGASETPGNSVPVVLRVIDTTGRWHDALTSIGMGLVPSISVQPGDLSVDSGETARFTLDGRGYPLPTFVWQVSQDLGQTFRDIPGETLPWLDVVVSADTDGAQYRAVLTNSLGTATSLAATLHVRDLDATPPTITPTVTGIQLSGFEPWYSSTVVTVAWGVTDPSGVSSTDGCEPWQSTGDEVTERTCSATDGAGNAGSVTVVIKHDQTPPITRVTGVVDGSTYLLGTVPIAGCQTSDALSGVRADALPAVDGGPVGVVSVTCAGAQDNAGNVGPSAQATYTVLRPYAWSGFFQPVDNLPTLNVAKAGSAVPVKFSLGADFGLGIMTPGYPKAAAVACDTGLPTDTIETTVSAGGSSLGYDTASGQYIYVWKTDKAWAGSCRTLTLRLSDGTEHIAIFKLAK